MKKKICRIVSYVVGLLSVDHIDVLGQLVLHGIRSRYVSHRTTMGVAGAGAVTETSIVIAVSVSVGSYF